VCAGDARTIVSVRDEVRAKRSAHEAVVLRLADGDELRGEVSRLSWRSFEIIGEQGLRREVPYAKVRAFLDPVTGEVVAAVRETAIDRHPARFVAIVGISVGVGMLVYVLTHIPRT
jgi:hypothetical protein